MQPVDSLPYVGCFTYGTLQPSDVLARNDGPRLCIPQTTFYQARSRETEDALRQAAPGIFAVIAFPILFILKSEKLGKLRLKNSLTGPVARVGWAEAQSVSREFISQHQPVLGCRSGLKIRWVTVQPKRILHPQTQLRKIPASSEVQLLASYSVQREVSLTGYYLHAHCTAFPGLVLQINTMSTHVHMYTHTHIHTYTHTYIHTYMSTYLHTY